ncbi:hypothetical protein [Streptomyces endophyticus]|uniref:Uncharacterized protein n=1 Tax=Streptomyces endophyticus TaxID=714166 RepID=A0ABU6F9U8_9ACTN|nr:hypothetical protein [Streptomyces endophyticus]MEB8339631.1 hypothetical protein [Streptomyces endophyticus]
MQIDVLDGPTLDLTSDEGSIFFHTIKEIVQASYVINDDQLIAGVRALVDEVRQIRKAEKTSAATAPQALTVEPDALLKTISAATATLHHLGDSEFRTRTGFAARDAYNLIQRLTALITPGGDTRGPEGDSGDL